MTSFVILGILYVIILSFTVFLVVKLVKAKNSSKPNIIKFVRDWTGNRWL
jgi:hypothetical protein